MELTPPPAPFEIYLESTVLIDLAEGHSKAKQLLRMLQKHRMDGLLQARTSAWAIMEAHSRLYDKTLEKLGIEGPDRGFSFKARPRDHLPPITSELLAVREHLQVVLDVLLTTTHGFLILPLSDINAGRVLDLGVRIVQETAIWPPDSLHLALALYSGCSMLIADDVLFLDKIELSREYFVETYRREEVSYTEDVVPFRFHGLYTRKSHIPPRTDQYRRQTAIEALRELGFH